MVQLEQRVKNGDLSPIEKLLLLSLLEAGPDAYVSQNELARICNVQIRSVSNVLRVLRDKDILEPLERNRHRIPRYVVHVERIPQLAEESSQYATSAQDREERGQH